MIGSVNVVALFTNCSGLSRAVVLAFNATLAVVSIVSSAAASLGVSRQPNELRSTKPSPKISRFGNPPERRFVRSDQSLPLVASNARSWLQLSKRCQAGEPPFRI